MKAFVILLCLMAMIPAVIYLGPPDNIMAYVFPMLDPAHILSPEKSLCLVTGASSGIGKDAVFALANAGFHVVAGIRKPTDGADFEGLPRISTVTLDVTKDADIKTAIETAASRAKQKGLTFTGLINNAGISGKFGEPVEWKSVEDVRNTMEVNFFGAVRVTKAALPIIRENHGRIIVVSSVGAKLSPATMSDYCASKAALNAFFTSLRRELWEAKVAVSVVQAGCVKSPLWAKARANYESMKERNRSSTAVYLPYRSMLNSWGNNDIGGLCEALAPFANTSTSPAIVHAMMSAHPRTMYSPGTFYDDPVRMIFFLQWLLPDRIMDWYLHDLVSHVFELRFPWWFKK